MSLERSHPAPPAGAEAGQPAAGRTRVRLRDFSKSLPMALLRARESTMKHFRAMLQANDVTEQQWRVLRALSSVETIEAAELAGATFLLPPSLSRILRDLEAKDFVQRRPDAADRRRTLVSIEPEGRNLIETVSPQSEAVYAEITRRLGPERLAQLQGLLRDLEAAMQEPIEI